MQIDSTRLRELRTARQWSQEQVAELSGLNLRTIQRLESGAKVSTESLRHCRGWRRDAPTVG